VNKGNGTACSYRFHLYIVSGKNGTNNILGITLTKFNKFSQLLAQFMTWPPNSPDLNPVDYSVWSILQEKVYKTRITDLDDLKHGIRTVWAKLDHAVIAAAVRQWRRRLSACVKADGGRFEHCF